MVSRLVVAIVVRQFTTVAFASLVIFHQLLIQESARDGSLTVPT